LLALLVIAGCATRPVNPPIAQVEPEAGYRFVTRQLHFRDQDNLVILAFSGGGTRAAAFSYGVLEALRDTQLAGPRGREGRVLDAVDMITGVSGGSFTALAYGLHGKSLFDRYEQDFLKRDVEGTLLRRLVDPLYWGDLWSTGWGRSELAARYYDEILFHGATFADLQRGTGPLIVVTATDISTGARVPFAQPFFDVLCSDLGGVELSRAAAASSAVPVVLSPVTLNNYGGTCGYRPPAWIANLVDAAKPPRPMARAMRQLAELEAYRDGAHRPYIHLVDGGVADNLGLRGVLDVLEVLEAEHALGRPTPLDHVRRIAIFVVNSLSDPATHWDQSVDAPGAFAILLKATGLPIDHFSFEAIELLRDTEARWALARRIRDSPAFDAARDPALAKAISAPPIDIYAIDVSFPALADKAEVAYLNGLPTSFVLPAEAVDRLRAAARAIVDSSPEFKRFVRDAGAHAARPAQP
jgi:NTE family protein